MRQRRCRTKETKRKRRAGNGFVRLHRRGRRLGRLRARQPADAHRGRHRVLLLEAGGEDRNLWIHVPIGYAKLFTDAQAQLALQFRARARTRRPLDHPAARQGDGRLVVDQRASLHPRAGARISTTGASSAMRAGASTTCCRTSAAPRTSSAARTSCTASAGRSRCRDVSEAHPLCDAFIDACEQAGLPRTDDFNGADAGRRRLFPAHHAQGPALVDRARLSQARAQAAESRGRVECADDAHPVRRPPRGRRRISSRTARRTWRARTAK